MAVAVAGRVVVLLAAPADVPAEKALFVDIPVPDRRLRAVIVEPLPPAVAFPLGGGGGGGGWVVPVPVPVPVLDPTPLRRAEVEVDVDVGGPAPTLRRFDKEVDFFCGEDRALLKKSSDDEDDVDVIF